jgi:hypothetical protein
MKGASGSGGDGIVCGGGSDRSVNGFCHNEIGRFGAVINKRSGSCNEAQEEKDHGDEGRACR